jgi:hypothetical protein
MSGRKQIIEIWKTVVNVQMHFNDIEMRIRAMFVTIILALFVSIGFLIDKRIYLDFGTFRIQFYTAIPFFGIFGTWLFYFIDRYWYHRLLVGAVKHAIFIEKKYKNILPELSLSDAIGSSSPYSPRLFTRLMARLLVSDERFVKTGLLHSDGKMELFYKSVMLILAVVTIVLSFTGGIQFGRRNERPEISERRETPNGQPPAPPNASTQ